MIQAHIQVQREMKVQSIPDCNKTLGLANLPWPGLEGTAQLLWFVSIPNWPWSPGPHHTKDRKSILWGLWELSYQHPYNCYCCSIAQSCPILCGPMDCSTPGFPVLHYLPEACSNSCSLSWWCHSTISSCHPLILPSIFPSIRVFFNESVLQINWPRYWSFSIIPIYIESIQ